MSEDVMSVGVMVPLNRKITEEEREEWNELLYNQGSEVGLSYYCDMAYTAERGEAYVDGFQGALDMAKSLTVRVADEQIDSIFTSNKSMIISLLEAQLKRLQQDAPVPKKPTFKR